MPNNKTAIVILFLILVLGAFLRFYSLIDTPPGLYPDEAMNGNNALEAIATGNFKVFYPENNGREGLFINLQAISIAVFGNKAWALRLVSAVFGTFTILGVFLLTRELFYNKNPKHEILNPKQSLNSNPPNSKPFGIRNFKNWILFRISDLEFRISHGETIALFSSFFLAVSYWHLNFSRIGFRAIMVPFFSCFILYFLLKGFRFAPNSQKMSILYIVLAGILAGLGLYTYTAFRFMPFVILVPLGWYSYKWWRKKIDSCAPCLILLFIFIAFVISLPLINYFAQNPHDFIGRSGQVSIFSTPSPLQNFVKSNLRTVSMFFIRGDCNWRHNYACRPELNPAVGIFFIIGVITSIANLSNPKHEILNPKQSLNSNPPNSKPFGIRNFKNWILFRISDLEFRILLILVWLAVMSLPATLTYESMPHALRSIGMIPPVMILSGIGAWKFIIKIKEWLEKQKQKYPQYVMQLERIKKELIFLFIILLISIPLATYRDYFSRWAYHSETQNAFSADALRLGQYLDTLPRETKKYVIINTEGIHAYVRGIPMPAQTIMFTTETFQDDKRSAKNIIYVPTEDIDEKLKFNADEKAVVTLTNSLNKEIVRKVKTKYPDLKSSLLQDFLVFYN